MLERLPGHVRFHRSAKARPPDTRRDSPLVALRETEEIVRRTLDQAGGADRAFDDAWGTLQFVGEPEREAVQRGPLETRDPGALQHPPND